MRHRPVLTLALVLFASTAVAQDQPQTIRESARGRVWWNSGNELLIDSDLLFPDAAKVRVGAPFVPGETGGGGAFSWDIIGGDMPGMSGGKRVEVIVAPGGMGPNGGGELGLFITKAGTWGNITDAAQARVFRATADVVEFSVPITAPNLQNGTGTVVISDWFIASPNGQYRTYVQDDGNLVTYKVMQPGNWLCATWSTLTGPITRPCE
jgi:hypothetical protein